MKFNDANKEAEINQCREHSSVSNTCSIMLTTCGSVMLHTTEILDIFFSKEHNHII